MLDAKESREAKLLRHLSDIFPEYQNGCEYGIHFIDVDGRNEKLKHSWFNVGEVQVVNIIKSNSNLFIIKTFQTNKQIF